MASSCSEVNQHILTAQSYSQRLDALDVERILGNRFYLHRITHLDLALNKDNLVSERIDSLPLEIFFKIFSHLNQRQIQTYLQANPRMRSVVIAAANTNEPIAIKNFIRRLLNHLNAETFSVQKELFEGILHKITPQHFPNLLMLKGYILEAKEQLIHVIKLLDVETANQLQLQCAPLPNFMENIFQLSAIYRELDKANLILDQEAKGNALFEVVKKLKEIGQIDEALEVAKAISYDYHKAGALGCLFAYFTHICNWSKAFEVVEIMPEGQGLKEMTYDLLIGILLPVGEIDKAFEAAKNIKKLGGKNANHSLYQCFEAFLQINDIDKALEVAKIFSNESFKSRAFFEVYRRLMQIGEIDRALEIQKTHLDRPFRN